MTFQRTFPFRFFLVAFLLLLPLSALSSSDKRSRVRIETSLGDIVIELFNETPAHRDNFLKLAKEGYYDGVLFHRVIENFMIQTGDPDSRHAAPGVMLGEGDPGYTLPFEPGLPQFYHYRGAVAAARESDDVNPKRESSGSQFYIVWGDTFSPSDLEELRDKVYEANGVRVEDTDEMVKTYAKKGGTPHLDGQYTVFGRVLKGLNVVRDIQSLDTDKNDRPLDDISIIRMEVLN